MCALCSSVTNSSSKPSLRAAGAPFEQLQANGMKTERLTQILRPKNPALGEAVSHSARHEIDQVVRKLAGTTAEIHSGEPRWLVVAQHYLRLTPPEREQTVVLSGTNFTREAINANGRAMLGFDGGEKIAVLRPLHLTEAERRSTASYSPGLVITPTKTYSLPPWTPRPRGPVKWHSGVQATVVTIDGGRVELAFPDGTRALWNPVRACKVASFRAAEIELAAGDLVRATTNLYQDGAFTARNGEVFKVVSIDKATGRLELLSASSGDLVRLDSTPLRPGLYLEHGYCTTIHSAQGRTTDRVILDACARSASAHEAAFYTAISRARHEVWIYTDDRAALPEAMARKDEKHKALDVANALEGKKSAAELAA